MTGESFGPFQQIAWSLTVIAVLIGIALALEVWDRVSAWWIWRKALPGLQERMKQ